LNTQAKKFRLYVDVQAGGASKQCISGRIILNDLVSGRTKIFPFNVFHPFDLELRSFEIFRSGEESEALISITFGEGTAKDLPPEAVERGIEFIIKGSVDLHPSMRNIGAARLSTLMMTSLLQGLSVLGMNPFGNLGMSGLSMSLDLDPEGEDAQAVAGFEQLLNS
jgi:hypothetical protein